MGTVRNDVIIKNGLNELLKKGSINLDKLSTHLAAKSEARGGPNSSDVIKRYKEDRYSRNEQVPTELRTESDVETFVNFGANMDNRGVFGIGADQNGDYATPGAWKVNGDSQLEQAVVDDLTTKVNNSTVFNGTDLAGVVTDKPEPKTSTQAETEPVPVSQRKNTEEPKTESPEHHCKSEESSNMPRMNGTNTLNIVFKEERVQAPVKEIISYKGELYQKMEKNSIMA